MLQLTGGQPDVQRTCSAQHVDLLPRAFNNILGRNLSLIQLAAIRASSWLKLVDVHVQRTRLAS